MGCQVKNTATRGIQKKAHFAKNYWLAFLFVEGLYSELQSPTFFLPPTQLLRLIQFVIRVVLVDHLFA
jgi:hypothetical protein